MDPLEVPIARLEEKLDALIERFDRREAEDKAILHELKARVDALERWRAFLVGGGAAGGAVLSVLITKLLALLH